MKILKEKLNLKDDKMIRVTKEAHDALKLLKRERRQSMAEIVTFLVDREMEDRERFSH